MAHFRATIQGQRGMASRLGSAKSGLFVTANGWESGVKIIGTLDEHGKDIFMVYATGGSNGRNSTKFLGKVRADATWDCFGETHK